MSQCAHLQTCHRSDMDDKHQCIHTVFLNSIHLKKKEGKKNTVAFFKVKLWLERTNGREVSILLKS